MMAGIKAKDTKPEILIRSGLHRQGFRFRLHSSRLRGKPDIILSRFQAAIFVNGCFWHGHECHLFKWPKTRQQFWRRKIEGNRARDKEVVKQLLASGWRVATVWECAIKGKNALELADVIHELSAWLHSARETVVISSAR